MENKVTQEQQKIYSSLYQQFHGTPMAVSSESWEHKKLRFSKIAKIFEDEKFVSVHDIGCGVGDFKEFIIKHYPNITLEYSGTEIVPEYIAELKKRFPEDKFYLRDLTLQPGSDQYDWCIMSGVFHQRREPPIPMWEKYAEELIYNSFSMAKKGIAFNFVSPFVDFYQTPSYYCNIYKFITFINDRLSRFFSINHNYALFECTFYVYKEEYIHSLYPQAEFQKYFKK